MSILGVVWLLALVVCLAASIGGLALKDPRYFVGTLVASLLLVVLFLVGGHGLGR